MTTQVCTRTVTLQEAHNFCDAADKLKQQTEKRAAIAALPDQPITAPPAPGTAAETAQASHVSTRLARLKGAEGLARVGRRVSTAIARPYTTNGERGLNKVLQGLFVEADTEGKVGSS